MERHKQGVLLALASVLIWSPVAAVSCRCLFSSCVLKKVYEGDGDFHKGKG